MGGDSSWQLPGESTVSSERRHDEALAPEGGKGVQVYSLLQPSLRCAMGNLVDLALYLKLEPQVGSPLLHAWVQGYHHVCLAVISRGLW